MSDKVEGTLTLDGLLEGRIPAPPDAEEKIRKWARFARNDMKLDFHLEVDGDRFNLLAGRGAVDASHLRPDPAEKIADLLDQLLKTFPPDDRLAVTSTVRSIEIRKGEEVQTLYAVGSDGAIDYRSRTVEADTVAPPEPLTPRERLRLSAGGVAVALLLLIGVAAAIHFTTGWGWLADKVTPVSADNLEVDQAAFAPYFTVDKREVVRRNGRLMLVLNVKLSANFPHGSADCERLLAAAATQPDAGLPARLTVEALARGYVRAEFFGNEGKFLGHAEVRTSHLPAAEADKAVLTIPMPTSERPTRLVITY